MAEPVPPLPVVKAKTPYKKGITVEDITHLTEIRGLTISQAARELGCDISNVSRMLTQNGITPGYLKIFKDSRADILAKLQADILSSLSNGEAIKNASFSQRAVAYGIFSDKEFRERQGADITVKYADLEGDYNTIRAKRLALAKELGVSDSTPLTIDVEPDADTE